MDHALLAAVQPDLELLEVVLPQSDCCCPLAGTRDLLLHFHGVGPLAEAPGDIVGFRRDGALLQLPAAPRPEDARGRALAFRLWRREELHAVSPDDRGRVGAAVAKAVDGSEARGLHGQHERLSHDVQRLVLHVYVWVQHPHHVVGPDESVPHAMHDLQEAYDAGARVGVPYQRLCVREEQRVGVAVAAHHARCSVRLRDVVDRGAWRMAFQHVNVAWLHPSVAHRQRHGLLDHDAAWRGEHRALATLHHVAGPHNPLAVVLNHDIPVDNGVQVVQDEAAAAFAAHKACGLLVEGKAPAMSRQQPPLAEVGKDGGADIPSRAQAE
mmetsp:Transcript_61564/g.190712  ORF Transcript_61564/g.190712 Transcript_61564/m.190712 type:complete len:325 (+) Transcript_61564:785-1759(+)